MKNMKMKKTVAMIAAATMAMSALAATFTVSADTTTTTSQSVADALAKVKYADTSLDARQTYNAATASVTYNVSGDYAVSADGELNFTFDGVESKEFASGILQSVKITVKSGSVTTSMTLVGDESTADSATDDTVVYYKDFDKLFTTSDDNVVTINIKDFPDALQTIYKSNKSVEPATSPTKTGFAWGTDNAWDVRKAKLIDSISVEFNLEQQTASTPTKKELTALGGIFDDVVMDITGDIREYTINANKIYIAAKYDAGYGFVALPENMQAKIDAMKALGCYFDFENYVEELADESYGDSVMTFTKATDAIADYLNNGMIVEAYRAYTTSGTDNVYWYDSYRETSDEADAAIATANAVTTDFWDTTPLDIRDSANRTEFLKVARDAKKGSGGALNLYISDKNYSAIVKDSELGYVASTDVAQNIANYSALNTALTNISNEIESTKEIANVYINTRTEIDNTVKTAVITESRPLMVSSTDWTNIGMLYTNQSGMPVLAQINSLIGDNKGCKLIFTVDPSTLPTTTATTQQNMFSYGYGMSAVGAARLRVNGAFALTYNDMASFDTATNTYTFDWDAVTAGKSGGVGNLAVWSLEFAATSPIGITGISVSVPDQEAYLAAIGADTEDKDSENKDNDTNNSGSLSAGEGTEDDSETVDEDLQFEDEEPATDDTPADTDGTDDAPAFDPMGADANNDNTVNTTPQGNPDTGNEGIAGVVAVMATAITALAVRKKSIDR